MDFYAGSEPRDFISFHLGQNKLANRAKQQKKPKEVTKDTESAEIGFNAIESTVSPAMPASGHVDNTVPPPTLLVATPSSSGSDESCGLTLAGEWNNSSRRKALILQLFKILAPKERRRKSRLILLACARWFERFPRRLCLPGSDR